MNNVHVCVLIAIALIAARSVKAITEILISIPDQTLALLDGERIVVRYRVLPPSSATGIMLAVIGHRKAEDHPSNPKLWGRRSFRAVGSFEPEARLPFR